MKTESESQLLSPSDPLRQWHSANGGHETDTHICAHTNMLRTNYTNDSNTADRSDTHVDMTRELDKASVWSMLWLRVCCTRGNPSIPVPRRAILLLLTLLALSLGCHILTFGALSALSSQLALCSAAPTTTELTPTLTLPVTLAATRESNNKNDANNQIPSTVARMRPIVQLKTQPVSEVQPVAPLAASPAAATVSPTVAPAAAAAAAAPAIAISTPLPASSSTPLPPEPTPLTLTSAQQSKLEEPWRWFETSGEHKDLVKQITNMRQELGRPLVILDIGLNIGSAPYAITKICPVTKKDMASSRASEQSSPN